MDNRIPAVLVPSVEKFTSLAEKRLPGFLSAFYIVGSIALDEFNPYFSDVDFIAMINHCAAENEIETLREIHQKMEGSYPHRNFRERICFLPILVNKAGTLGSGSSSMTVNFNRKPTLM